MIERFFRYCQSTPDKLPTIPYSTIADADTINTMIDRLLWYGNFRFDLSTMIVFGTEWLALLGIGLLCLEGLLWYHARK